MNSEWQKQIVVKTLYRRPEQGLIFGVCAGLAEYWQIPVIWIRLLATVALFAGLFIFTIIIYCALAALLETPPLEQSGQWQWQNIQQQLQENEQRLRRIEHYLTSTTYRTERDFRQL